MTDFDLWFERVLVVATVGTYFGASFYAAFALSGYVGALLLSGLMAPPLVYVLVKQNQRKARAQERAAAAEFRGEQVGTGAVSRIPTYE